MKTKQKRKKWWIWLIVAFYIYLIFKNSFAIANVSEKASYKVTYMFAYHLNHFGLAVDNFSLFHHYIRKLAHFSEFAGLGFLVTIAIHICPLFESRCLNLLIFLLGVPAMDEGLQYFVDGRSCEVFDMLIDGSGFLFGGLCAYILVLILKDIFTKKDRNT